MRAALGDISGVHLMYVAEIVPPVKTAVEAFESKYSWITVVISTLQDTIVG